jgi:hypothetical protein
MFWYISSSFFAAHMSGGGQQTRYH